jgi:hypothetical protein
MADRWSTFVARKFHQRGPFFTHSLPAARPTRAHPSFPRRRESRSCAPWCHPSFPRRRESRSCAPGRPPPKYIQQYITCNLASLQPHKRPPAPRGANPTSPACPRTATARPAAYSHHPHRSVAPDYPHYFSEKLSGLPVQNRSKSDGWTSPGGTR